MFTLFHFFSCEVHFSVFSPILDKSFLLFFLSGEFSLGVGFVSFYFPEPPPDFWVEERAPTFGTG